MVSRVIFAEFESVDAVITRQSKTRSSLLIPIDSALFIIFFATLNLASTSFFIPVSSKVRQTTAQPLSLTRGNISSIDSSLPLTEFISALYG